jgi:hypothetical protein
MRNFHLAVNEESLLESLVNSYIYETWVMNFLHVTILNVKYGKPIIYRKTFAKSELLLWMKYNAGKNFYSHYDKDFSSFVNSSVEEIFHSLFSYFGKNKMGFASGKNMYLPDWFKTVKDSNIDFSEEDVLNKLSMDRIIIK